MSMKICILCIYFIHIKVNICMSMHIFTHMCIHVIVFHMYEMYLLICMQSVCIAMHEHIYAFIFVIINNVCKYIYANMYVCIYMYKCTCFFVYASMLTFVHVFTCAL